MLTKFIIINDKGARVMVKKFGVIALLLLATVPALAAQRGVVCELFTATW
jgi:hypothetical protein